MLTAVGFQRKLPSQTCAVCPGGITVVVSLRLLVCRPAPTPARSSYVLPGSKRMQQASQFSVNMGQKWPGIRGETAVPFLPTPFDKPPPPSPRPSTITFH